MARLRPGLRLRRAHVRALGGDLPSRRAADRRRLRQPVRRQRDVDGACPPRRDEVCPRRVLLAEVRAILQHLERRDVPLARRHGCSRDGRSIYTTEVHNSRVQRFDRQADGSYRYATTWGNDIATDPYRVGLCMRTHLAAPVTSRSTRGATSGSRAPAARTCRSSRRTDSPVRELRRQSRRGSLGILPNGDQQRSHNLAIDASGNVISRPRRAAGSCAAQGNPGVADDPRRRGGAASDPTRIQRRTRIF